MMAFVPETAIPENTGNYCAKDVVDSKDATQEQMDRLHARISGAHVDSASTNVSLFCLMTGSDVGSCAGSFGR